MEKFEGFSEEEIRSLTSAKTINLGADDDDGDVIKSRKRSSDSSQNACTAVYKNLQNKSRHQNRLPRKNVARERVLKGNYNTFASSNSESLPKEARLHISKIPEEEEYEPDESKNKSRISHTSLSEAKANEMAPRIEKTVEEGSKNVSSSVAAAELGPNLEKNKELSNVADDVKSEEKKKMIISQRFLNSEETAVDALDQFESRQKLMEEQNRQRKEILKRALADRAKKTHEEVKRLNEIEGELKKLDLLLSNDVAIIRNQIESASIEFMEAQKRYDRAEKEFLDAKLDLFNKKERKELLTSHLCTIIEQNEMRKAKKLSDLMMQLEIGPKNSLITSQITVELKTEQEEPVVPSEPKEKLKVLEQKLHVNNGQQESKVSEVKTKEENDV